MGEKLVVGSPVTKGLKTNLPPFMIDNDSFPILINAYQWRGRVKRKRGTEFLTRLQRNFPSASIGNTGASPWTINTIYSNYTPLVTPETNATIVPGSVTITISAGPIVFTDQGNGTLTSITPGNSGTINYLTGVIVLTHTAGAGVATTAFFSYYPDLPVLGLEDFVQPSFQFVQTVAFDQIYSYRILTASPFSSYDVSFYWNPASGSFPGYTQKSTWTKTTWNGTDYQQFFTCNYQGALWATNGVPNPYLPSSSTIGMQFKPITNVVINAAGPPALATLTINAHGLVMGDFVFVNEVQGITGINFQTGYVVSADPQAANIVQVEFPNATLGGAYISGGITQYLTNRADPTKDSLRWYNGDPITATTNPSFVTGGGWVNFAPPISFGIPAFSPGEVPAKQYYLVGAKIIFPFKDRLLFFGPVIQASTGNPIFLQDTIIWSQNGTPFYTASFTGDPTLTTTTYTPILVPTNQTATVNAYWQDFTGYGGFLTSGLDQPINTVSPNEDALILGFNTVQTRLFFSGNDLLPFSLFIINSELGSSSTFSAITMDQGVLSRGDRAFVITSQTQCQRIDLEIPDEVFETNLFNNGTERICAGRDFINEWVYFSYPANISNAPNFTFNNTTLQYNYRDQSWGLFKETYTTYGSFKKQSGFIWSTVGNTYPNWISWNDPWNSGESVSLQPKVIAGNQQGFVCIRGEGTEEANSLYISAISASVITSPNHGLNSGDYVLITGALGVSGINGTIFRVGIVTLTTFQIDGMATGAYIGGGVIQRIYNPFIQTKQFPLAWDMMRKTRIGTQMYLLTTTLQSQIQLLIFLSTDSANAYNDTTQVPDASVEYSTVLFTCPESLNLGLTPYTTNLQMPTATTQEQIWHRINTSLIGDTVQLGFTMSDKQIRSINNAFAEIEMHGFILDLQPSFLLA